MLFSKQYSRTADVFRHAPTPLAVTVYSITQWDLEFEALGPLLASQWHVASRIQHGSNQLALNSLLGKETFDYQVESC
jgi:hypothetical protein